MEADRQPELWWIHEGTRWATLNSFSPWDVIWATLYFLLSRENNQINSCFCLNLCEALCTTEGTVKRSFTFFLDRCWFCHKASGKCHQTNSSDQPRWGQSGAENPEHLQEHRDLLQTGRGVRWDHTWWPTCQSKLSYSLHDLFINLCR